MLAIEVNGALSDQCPADLERLVEVQAINVAMQELNLTGALGLRWKGVQTDFMRLEAGYTWSRQLRAAQAACAADPLALAALRERVRLLVQEASELLEPDASAGRALLCFVKARSQAMTALEALVPLSGTIAAELIPAADPDWASQLATVLVGWIESVHALKDWCGWQRIKRSGETLGLEKLLGALEQGLIDPASSVHVFQADYARWWIGLVVEATPQLRNFAAATHEKRIERFREIDKAMLGLASRLVRLRLSRHTRRDGAQRGDKEHLLLNHELQKRMRHLPVRQLMERMPKLMRQLTPCLMMSPLSVAQFLPADAEGVDLVIFDEASQIATWDAVGAIGRGAQVVVVGDPKQLPPTDFFQRQATGELDGDAGSDQQDLESVLDECMARGLPTVQLNWHYRSRHESLIAFSNHAYYESRLITFPSPSTDDRAVSLRYVQSGVYAKGGARTNLAEAQEIVEETVRQLERTLAGTSKRSIGIVTFNAAQQDLIENLLEDARRKNPALEAFFAEDARDPVMIKSLESVQGEERDVMLFSLTYGPDAAGKIAMNFGPLNNTGGERRLNVAVTRAREQLIVFSSLRAEQIDLARTNAQGVRDLKRFLAYAKHGARAMIAVDDGSVGDFDSGFEEAVAVRLTRLGWEVRPQIGVSGFRIDLGVVDPDAAGRFLAGVECDGATYHRSATARDRDRLRQTVLEGLGWTILRIWSTEWWANCSREMDRLDQQLKETLRLARLTRADRATMERGPAEMLTTDIEIIVPVPSDDRSLVHEMEPPNHQMKDGPALERIMNDYRAVTALATEETLSTNTEITTPPAASAACAVDTPLPSAAPDRFYDADYTNQLTAIVRELLIRQGPLREDRFVQAVARLHGFQRAGQTIRERALSVVPKAVIITEDWVGRFFWPIGSKPSEWSIFRAPPAGESRDPSELPIQELVVLARLCLSKNAHLSHAEAYLAANLAMRDACGLKRLGEQASARCGAAIQAVRGTPFPVTVPFLVGLRLGNENGNVN
jgi:very-short-patch-repair endonuclease